MKKTNVLKLISLTCTIALLFSITACGNGDSSATSTAGNNEQTTTEKDSTNEKDTPTEASTAGIASLSDEAPSDPMAKYDPGITFSTVIALDDAMQEMIGVKSDVLTNNSWFNGYKEDLGIDVDIVWSIPGAQYEEKLNTQISANDLPDVFRVNDKQLKLLVDNGMVADMTQVFADYSTDFTKQMMEDDNHIALSQATFGGKLMALPRVDGNRDGVPIMWIRRDWLEKTGKSVPTTVEELEAVALAFVHEDPDENGKDDTYGIALHKDLWGSGLCDVSSMFEMFDAHVSGSRINNAWLEKDGTLVNGIIQPEVEEALVYFADWYSKGIFDKEFIAKDSAKVAEDLTAGTVGIAFGAHWNAFWPYPDSLTINPESDWAPFEIPSANSSPVNVMVNGSANSFFVVNVDCENPEAAVKLYNYFYAKDCALSPDFDKTFHIPSSEMMEKPEESYQWAIIQTVYPMQNLFIHRGVVRYNEGDKTAIDNSWVADNALQGEQYLEDKVANSQFWSSYMWSGAEGAFSIVDLYDKNGQMLQNAYILADTDAMTSYGTTLEQLALETITKMINGSTPVSDFSTFIDQWNSLGGDEITAEVNAVMGR